MKKLKTLLVVACLTGASGLGAQATDKSLTVDDLVSWERITQQQITNNGEWVACKMEPWKGDAKVFVYGNKGQKVAAFDCVDKFQFSASSTHLLLLQNPPLKTVEKLKLQKTKADKMPMNTLMIYSLGGQTEKVDSIKMYQLASKVDWMAYQRSRKDSTLYVRTLDGKSSYSFPSVIKFGFAKESSNLFFVEKQNELQKLYVINPDKGMPFLLKEGKGVFTKMTFDEQGKNLAFLYTDNKKTAYKSTELWLSENKGSVKLVAKRGISELPHGWVVSEHSKLCFSKSASRLFFGTSPEPKQKDTLQLAENRPAVQVWSWNEPVQYTVQQFNKEQDLKKNYGAVYNLNDGRIVQLANVEQPKLMLGDEGDSPYALISTSRPYSVSWMWEGRTRNDYYKVSLIDGSRELLSKADYGEYRLSPKGNYAYWYAETDSCWYTISLVDGKKYQLTTPETFVGWDEDNDVPNYPEAYGAAGWSDNDDKLYLYDRYDIWQFDPRGQIKPVNMTKNGRVNRISYRLIKLDDKVRIVDNKKTLLLKGTNEITKGDGFYSVRFKKPNVPKELLAGKFMLSTILKAKDSDKLVFTKESYELYPDLYYTNISFDKSLRLTDGYKQQESIRWGSAELVSWTSLDGRKLEGVLYKPANFDSNKKYPMIVNFYERNSDELHSYRHPQPHRSTIDYRLYNSNDYIIFNPDVRYRDGHPGKSCYNCVIPGIQMILDKGFVDEKAIGAQGHSWGGDTRWHI